MAIFGSAAFFNNVEFSAEVDFRDVHFETKAYFSRTTFRAPAYFINATFNGKATFSHATFSAEAHFNFLTFNSDVKFRGTTFAGYVGFAGNKEGDAFTSGSSLDLQFAKIEKPDHVTRSTRLGYIRTGSLISIRANSTSPMFTGTTENRPKQNSKFSKANTSRRLTVCWP